MDFDYFRFCWIWKISLPFISQSRLATLAGIPTWELETPFGFSLHNEHIWIHKWLLSLLMFTKRKEWGAVSWKSMGHQGALRKETMAEEMSVFCTHNVSVNNTFSWVWGPWMDLLQVPVLFPPLSWGPYIITLRFSFTLEKQPTLYPLPLVT